MLLSINLEIFSVNLSFRALQTLFTPPSRLSSAGNCHPGIKNYCDCESARFCTFTRPQKWQKAVRVFDASKVTLNGGCSVVILNHCLFGIFFLNDQRRGEFLLFCGDESGYKRWQQRSALQRRTSASTLFLSEHLFPMEGTLITHFQMRRNEQFKLHRNDSNASRIRRGSDSIHLNGGKVFSWSMVFTAINEFLNFIGSFSIFLRNDRVVPTFCLSKKITMASTTKNS